VYYSKSVKRNILTFSDASKHHQVEWDPNTLTFNIGTENGPMAFSQVGQVFIRDFNIREANITSAKENKTKFTSSEVKRATLAVSKARIRIGCLSRPSNQVGTNLKYSNLCSRHFERE
jgi:hypothetical protein